MPPVVALRALRTVAACIALTLSLAPAAAGGQAAEWWRVASIQRELQLTPKQVSALEAIFRGTHRRRLALNERLSRVETDLQKAIARGDEAAAAALIGPVEAARSKRNTARIMMLMRMYRVLTLRQRRMLAALQVRRPSRAEGMSAPKR